MRMLLFILIALILVSVIPLPQPKKQATPAFNVEELVFPKDFFWGAATAAHQVEGNQNNNLTEWEHKNAQRLAANAENKFRNIVPDWEMIKTEATDPNNYISGAAIDHYNRYPEDLDLAKQLGLNAYRFSIEWSRIEPVQGRFDELQIDHYRRMIAAVKQRGMTPFVTLWHRSQPKWIADQGDWENPKTIEDYAKYVEYVVDKFHQDVDYWMPFNEPELHVGAGFVEGTLPPQVKSLRRGNKVFENMMAAHVRAYKIIREKDTEAFVGSTHAIQHGSAEPNNLLNALVNEFVNYQANHRFMDKTKESFDFIAVQYYGPIRQRLTLKGVKAMRSFDPVRTDFGWDMYPAGIYFAIKDLYGRYKKPVIITENGIADKTDTLRAKYIREHLYWVKKAMDEGVPVKGYFYWSLLDNFEWDSGFWPRFGLIEVDRATQKRTVRQSAYEYARIIKQSQ